MNNVGLRKCWTFFYGWKCFTHFHSPSMETRCPTQKRRTNQHPPEKNERERKTRRLTSQSFKAESRVVVVRMARIQQHKKYCCVPVSSIIVFKISRFLSNSSPHVYFKNNKLFFISTASEGSHRSFGVNGFVEIILNIYQRKLSCCWWFVENSE